MTPWEMTDVDGKNWTLASLKGKVVYINLWSTTCLPCQQELALVQQLYQEIKLRDDVQVVTFNLDYETGRVAPFLKEHGYTFPVLLAKDYVDGLLGEYAVPQNWILDVAGNWRWQGEGTTTRTGQKACVGGLMQRRSFLARHTRRMPSQDPC